MNTAQAGKQKITLSNHTKGYNQLNPPKQL